MIIESLEGRRLLAGVTLITHGYNGDVNGWVATAAADVQARAGGRGASTVYTMSVTKGGSGLAVSAFVPDTNQRTLSKTSAAEMIIKLDWSTVSGGAYTTGDVADVVDRYLLSTHGSSVPTLASLPMQLIGHSRGASLVTALSQDLGRSGVWVDQVTYLDPHPVDGDNDFFGVNFGDAAMTVHDNVAFADNYWRTDGNANNNDFDGEFVDGTYDGNLNATVQKNYFVSAHGAVTAYYVGTIDTDTSAAGDHPVIDSWYDTNTTPPRDETGFYYSRLVGGARPSSGVSDLLGGTADRSASGESGSQWANVLNFTTRGDRRVTAGGTLDVRFAIADRDSSLRVDVYADTDTNPYNGGLTAIGARRFASADEPTNTRLTATANGLAERTYAIAARVTDEAGHTRWVYSPRTIGVTAPDFATVTDGTLTVSGTAGADEITLARNSSGVTTATLNGVSQTIAAGAFSAVVIQAGDGNDSVDASGMTTAIYVNAGPGFDNVTGGSGNDTLSGGAQSDTLTGNIGDDVLNGNGGNNLLVGNGGYDRLYSANESRDTMIGGSNADRFFGGNGPDSMVGGTGNDKLYANAGNDTLIGGEGADILNGGSGTNTGDTDPLDLRTDIQILI